MDRLELRPGRVVVDVAAGTGKLTRLFVPSGARVVAVEPLAEMRAQLQQAVPGVDALEGTAEALPLGESSADAITVAAAFHWFRRDRGRRGYATEAAQACLDAALAHLDVARIVAVVDEENLRSSRVAERIGMSLAETVELRGRPHRLFALRRGPAA